MEKKLVQDNNKASTPETQSVIQKVSQSTSQINEAPKQNPWLVIGLAVLILLLLGTTGFFAYQSYQLKQQALQKQPTSLPEATKTPEIPSPVPTLDPTANWKIYENKNYGFSLKYPNNFKMHNLIEKPFYTLEEPIAFGIVLIQDIYANLAQTPVIKVQLVPTSKSINQILDQLRAEIENTKGNMTDPEHMYYGANPPKINNIEAVRVGSIETTKVERYQGPGAPNAEILEYYIKSPTHIFILTANYGTNNPDVGQNGTLEKETLSKIISTFQFLQ